mmetsp:Transcript_18028/g.27933  ORF Transcript_18028/g.27933 Transcript_18028/m.27933 type:complete len:231 (+) Transcript_18028:35-727(+)|eukprot:CAMPEP_0117037088 /NCGR_PEP_ID=MMETSP0472-20121206/26221_1 /TAXON_ID=693140 ORGANISM="Tiarina fusus, Strain LIS" /NCGR_SAMPLE_ID=MMETSP0472 /ASSEMBLY_ACC=CAM_ASM_000603 /LENGTH=230 /DNA_ID=CAMNT_0004747013 /DNA_START=35 /DNA_END=727 /DNA_ORIENTATION=+
MKFSVLSALALASAPSAVKSWSMGPLFYPGDAMVSPSAMLARQQALADRMLRQTDQLVQLDTQLSPALASPRYDLVDDDTKFQLSVDVPGIKMEDIDISLKDDYLTVRGQRVAADDSSKLISKFSQNFSVDPAVEVDKFSATLNNGVLIVTAPKDMKRLEEAVRKISIRMGPSTEDAVVAEVPSVSSVDTGMIDLDKDDDKDDGLKNNDVKVNVGAKKDGATDTKDEEKN